MGQYVESNLTSGENVVYEAKLHWMIFVSLYSFFTVMIGPILQWISSEFAITSKRIIIKVGLITRRTLEMNLSKIESVNVDQGIFGRMLDYGNITIVGTGGTRETFPMIASPLEFRKAFQQLHP